MEITKYTVGVAFKFDNREQRKLDEHLKRLEKKFKIFSDKKLTFEISNFTVNQRKLEAVLGNALDSASKRVTFEISNFVVNRAALTRAVSGMGGSVVGSGQLSRTEWDRRTLMSARLRREEAVARQAERLQLASMRASRSGTVRGAAAGGAFGGSLGSFLPGGGVLGAGLALAGGGYGLSALNQRNQQVVSAQLQSQAVVQQAGGTAQQGTASFDYLRAQANRIGFNYLEAAPDYNKLLSGLTGAGVGLEESQRVFTGFAELSRVNKLDRVQQNRLFRALSQVAGKGKLQAEELTGQIAEALPGGTALFAQAYQRQIGGSKTGKDAIAQLMDDMKKGRVKSDILTFAAQLASERAQPGLAAASTASQAEQARFQNVTNDMAVLASQKGVEEGFARIFRTLNQGLAESGPLVTKLAQGFNEATKWADDLLLFPQSFARALEGRDSLVADWLGADATAQLREDWISIKGSMETISNISTPAWLPTLEKLSKDIAAQFRVIAALSEGDFSGLGSALLEFGKSRFQSLGNAVATGPNFALRTIGQIGHFNVPQIGFGENTGSGYWSPRSNSGIGMPLVFNDPLNEQSFNYPDPFSKALDAQKQAPNAFGMQSAKLNMSLDVSIKADGFDDFEEKTKSSLKNAVKGFVEEEYGNVMLQFNEKE